MRAQLVLERLFVSADNRKPSRRRYKSRRKGSEYKNRVRFLLILAKCLLCFLIPKSRQLIDKQEFHLRRRQSHR